MRALVAIIACLTWSTATAQTYSVTLRVDLSEVSPAPEVSVAGDFQVAAGFPSDWTPGSTLLEHQGAGIYHVTVGIPAGTYGYKFINGIAWGDDEAVPSACAVNGNRQMVITGDTVLDPVCFSSCDPCPGLVEPVTVRLQVDMYGQTVNAPMSVAGDFQDDVVGESWSDWTPGATQISDPDGDGVYSRIVAIPAGTYQYKFINGSSWGEDEAVPAACAISGAREVVITAPGPVSVPVSCFSSCEPCNVLFTDGLELGSAGFWSGTSP